MTTSLQHTRYRFDRIIATGGMGEVWAATDTLLEREVAVKLLKREYADDPVFRRRFEAEARATAALQHPNIATVLDFGELDCPEEGPSGSSGVPSGGVRPLLVMELVQGQPLSALLAGGQRLVPELAADLLAQAADGLHAAHEHGIVHRDVKPGNLLVTPEGRVKVTDFGIARAGDAVPLTLTGQVVGTPHYLSPEQARGQEATAASDVYCLGIVLFECLAGRRPYAGESPVGTALMHIRDPLPELPSDVPAALQDVVRTATAKDPAQRFASAAAFASALLGRPSVVGAPAGPVVPVATATGVTPQVGGDLAAGATAAAGGSRGRGVLLPLLAAACALLMLLAALWAVALRGDRVPAAADPLQGRSELVRVRAGTYVGAPADWARRRLTELGMTVRVRTRPNPGDEFPGTVAAVDPAGLVEPGARVTLAVWGRPPLAEPEPEPATEPVVPPPVTQPPREGSGDDGRGQDRGGDGSKDVEDDVATGSNGGEDGGGGSDVGNGGGGEVPDNGAGEGNGKGGGNGGGKGGGNGGGNGNGGEKGKKG